MKNITFERARRAEDFDAVSRAGQADVDRATDGAWEEAAEVGVRRFEQQWDRDGVGG